MQMTFHKKLPIPQDVKKEFPVTPRMEQVKAEMDGGKPQEIDWFKVEWDWVLDDTRCSIKLREDSLKALGKQLLEKEK